MEFHGRRVWEGSWGCARGVAFELWVVEGASEVIDIAGGAGKFDIETLDSAGDGSSGVIEIDGVCETCSSDVTVKIGMSSASCL